MGNEPPSSQRESIAAVPLDYEDARRPPRRWPMVLVVGLLLMIGLAMVVLLFGVRVTVQPTVQVGPQAVQFGSSVRPAAPLPVPSQEQSAERVLPPEGVELTIRQREERWLPGGTLKLTLDDVTSGQVLITISDADGQVVVGPQSVRQGTVVVIPTADAPWHLELLRLENHLTGDDFGVFRLKSATDEAVGQEENETRASGSAGAVPSHP